MDVEMENKLEESENRSNKNDLDEQTESQEDLRRMPKSIPYILVNVFFERFCTAGVLAIFPLFLHLKLGLDTNTSTSLFHIYESTTFFFNIIGAIIADSLLGLYKCISTMTLVYVIGLTIVAVSMIDPFQLPIEAFVITGFIIAIIGNGSIKANVNTFGGNQHKLPEQAKQLHMFFSLQFWGVKWGSLLARISFPILRQDVKCFGNNDCYVVIFVTAAIAMSLGLLAFLSGTSHYKHVESNGNMLIRMFKCIKHALLEKRRSKEKLDENQHWLYYAEKKYGRQLIVETLATFKVLVMFIPIPLYWSLYLQQSSRFVFQASKMDLNLKWFSVKPDQISVLNSSMVIFFIPMFDKFLYPILEKFKIGSLLHRMIYGCSCTFIAFIITAILQTQVEKSFISVVWQFPSLLFLALGEVFMYISHMSFAYREAPVSMKPVMVAFFYFTIAIGGLFVALISGASLFESQVHEYLFFAFLMFLDIILLSFLTHRYKHTDHEMIKALSVEDKSRKTTLLEDIVTRL